MTKSEHTGVPRVDEAIDLDTIRDEAEEIAVPAFDYIAEGIGAVVDGLTGHAHDDESDTHDTKVDEEVLRGRRG